MIKVPCLVVALLVAGTMPGIPSSAMAQTQTPPTSVATGAANVTAEGNAVTREGDQTFTAETVVEGSSNVRINGKPVARAGDKTACGGVIVGGSATVFVNGKPLATQGSTVTGCTK